MAGHSKWANIKAQEGGYRQENAQVWTKLIREVTVGGKREGGDAGANPRLRWRWTRLTPRICRKTPSTRIRRGAGVPMARTTMRSAMKVMVPAEPRVIVDCMTDNRNRTA